MATTVHIPQKLLRTVDREARRLKVSRNRFIVEALQRRLAEDATNRGWPPGFFERIERRARNPEYRKGVRELSELARAHRKSKPIIAL